MALSRREASGSGAWPAHGSRAAARKTAVKHEWVFGPEWQWEAKAQAKEVSRQRRRKILHDPSLCGGYTCLTMTRARLDARFVGAFCPCVLKDNYSRRTAAYSRHILSRI